MRQLAITFLLLLITCSLNAISQEDDSIIFLPYSESISQVEWSPDGTKLAVNFMSEIHIIDTNNWERITTILGSTSKISWYPNSQLIAGVQGGSSEQVLIWDTNTGSLVRELRRSSKLDTPGGIAAQPQTVAWHPDGNIIATDATMGFDELLFWNIGEENESSEPILIKTTSKTWHNSTNLEWSPDGEMLLTSGSDDAPPGLDYMTVPSSYVFDLDSREVIFTIPETSLTWGSDSKKFASRAVVGSARRITIWDIASDSAIRHFDKHTNTIISTAWNIYFPVIASADIDNNLFFWNPDTGQSYNVDNFDLIDIRDLAWKPNTNVLAIASKDGIHIQNYILAQVK